MKRAGTRNMCFFFYLALSLLDHWQMYSTLDKNYTPVSGVPTKSLRPIDQARALRLATYTTEFGNSGVKMSSNYDRENLRYESIYWLVFSH